MSRVLVAFPGTEVRVQVVRDRLRPCPEVVRRTASGEDPSAVLAALWREMGVPSGGPVRVLLGRGEVILRRLRLPGRGPEELHRMAGLALAAETVFSPEELVTGAVRIGADPDGTPIVVAAGTHVGTIERLGGFVRRAGGEVEGFVVSTWGVWAASVDRLPFGTTCVVDIDRETTEIVVFRDRRVFDSRAWPWGWTDSSDDDVARLVDGVARFTEAGTLFVNGPVAQVAPFVTGLKEGIEGRVEMLSAGGEETVDAAGRSWLAFSGAARCPRRRDLRITPPPKPAVLRRRRILAAVGLGAWIVVTAWLAWSAVRIDVSVDRAYLRWLEDRTTSLRSRWRRVSVGLVLLDELRAMEQRGYSAACLLRRTAAVLPGKVRLEAFVLDEDRLSLSGEAADASSLRTAREGIAGIPGLSGVVLVRSAARGGGRLTFEFKARVGDAE